MRVGKLVSLAALASVALATGAMATEGGGQMHPVGVNTVVPGIAPGPDQFWWQNYTVYYTADRFNDSRGNSAVPGFGIDVAVDALRFFKGWDVKIGPFGLASAIVTPFLYLDVKTPAGETEEFDIADITLQPLYLTYSNSSKTFFSYFGVDFFVPTHTAVSREYYAAVPTITSTWFPTKGVDLNLTAAVELSLSENESTNYRSGDLLMIDYSGHVKPFQSLPNVSIGLNGYYLKQLNGDEVNGVDIGFEGEAFAIGPEIIVETGPAQGVVFKWQHEVFAENRPEGEKFWVQFQIPFNRDPAPTTSLK